MSYTLHKASLKEVEKYRSSLEFVLVFVDVRLLDVGALSLGHHGYVLLHKHLQTRLHLVNGLHDVEDVKIIIQSFNSLQIFNSWLSKDSFSEIREHFLYLMVKDTHLLHPAELQHFSTRNAAGC